MPVPTIDGSYAGLALISDPEERALVAIETIEATRAMSKALYVARDAAIVEMHVVRGRTYDSIAISLDMTKEAVAKVVRTAIGSREVGRQPAHAVSTELKAQVRIANAKVRAKARRRAARLEEAS